MGIESEKSTPKVNLKFQFMEAYKLNDHEDFGTPPPNIDLLEE